MKKSGDMWILDDDDFFDKVFQKTKDKFEDAHLTKALSYATTWEYAVDGGAHYGSWTRPMATRFKNVISFEPRQDIYACLQKNTNHLPNVNQVNKAIGETPDFVTVGEGNHYDNSGCGTVIGPGTTPLITIDSLNLPSLGFLKLDVEGYELYALRGAEETLKRCKPVILYEDKGHSEDYNIKLGECADYLKSLGATELCVLAKRDFVYGWK